MRHLAAGLALSLALAACRTVSDPAPAPAEPDAGLVALEALDAEPQRRTCPFPESQRVPSSDLRVALSFVVTPEGTVEPGTVRIHPYHHSTAPQWRQDEAMDLVLQCTYRPALVDGMPVSVRWHEVFHLTS